MRLSIFRKSIISIFIILIIQDTVIKIMIKVSTSKGYLIINSLTWKLCWKSRVVKQNNNHQNLERF